MKEKKHKKPQISSGKAKLFITHPRLQMTHPEIYLAILQQFEVVICQKRNLLICFGYTNDCNYSLKVDGSIYQANFPFWMTRSCSLCTWPSPGGGMMLLRWGQRLAENLTIYDTWFYHMRFSLLSNWSNPSYWSEPVPKKNFIFPESSTNATLKRWEPVNFTKTFRIVWGKVREKWAFFTKFQTKCWFI